MKFSIYIAGSLFTEAEQAQRLKEEAYLRELLKKEGLEDKVIINNPISNPFNDKSTLPTAKDIVAGDTNQIKESDFILLNLDNQLDAGVFVELGQIAGLNFSQDKRVYAVLSDSRVETAGEYTGYTVPFGINQYVIGTLQHIHSNIYSSHRPAIERLVSDLLAHIERE